MSRGRLVFLALSLGLLLALLSGGFSRAATEDEAGVDSLYKNLSVFSEVLRLVRQAYVDEKPIDELLEGALDGTTDALGPFATYVPKDQVEEFRRAQEVAPRRSGVVVAKERGICYVVAVTAGGPASLAGLEAGDIITKIDTKPTRLIPLWKIQSLFAGEPRNRMHLEILRVGQAQEVDLELDQFALPPAELTRIQGVPVLQLREFGIQTSHEMAAILSKLRSEAMDRLLIDLRGSSGADAELGYAAGRLFVSGALGQLVVREEVVKTFSGADVGAWSGKLVVLMDRAAHGPAEVLAAVLRQGADARLVGARSFGYAGRPELETLSTGGALLLTKAFYSGPDGKPILEGLTPDVEIDAAPANDGLGEEGGAGEALDDPVLARGIELLLGEEDLQEVA